MKFPGDSLLRSRHPATNNPWLGQRLATQRAFSPLQKVLQQQQPCLQHWKLCQCSAVPKAIIERGIRDRYFLTMEEGNHLKNCCLQLLLILAAPDDFTRGEGPARRLPKKYNIKLNPKSRFLWWEALTEVTAQAMSTWISDQQRLNIQEAWLDILAAGTVQTLQ